MKSHPGTRRPEQSVAEWNAEVRALIATTCTCGHAGLYVELNTGNRHYARLECPECSKFYRWIKEPPESHTVAWARKGIAVQRALQAST